MDHFHFQGHRLFAEEVPVANIAERFGTPCYVYSRATLERHWLAFDTAFGHHPHLICFAVKANSNLAVLNLLARLGSGFDIVSVGELERVLAAGCDPAKVIFSGVGKREDEMRRALEVGIRCFNLESEAELDRLEGVAGALGVIIYTDPADNGYMTGLPYPQGTAYTSSTVERGSLLTLAYTGDPLTPFAPALPLDGHRKVARLSPEQADLPRIPVTPLPYGSAVEILRRMTGAPVPRAWQGGLPCTYRLAGGPELTVRLRVDQPKGIRRITDVVGRDRVFLTRSPDHAREVVETCVKREYGAIFAGGQPAWASEPRLVTVGGGDVDAGTLMLAPYRPMAFASTLVCGDRRALFGIGKRDGRDVPALEKLLGGRRREAVEEVRPADRGGARPPDDDAGRAVRDLGRVGERQPRAEGDAEGREDGVARARDVEDLAGAGRDPQRRSPFRKEEHPLLRELHEDRVELEVVAQARREPRDGPEVAGALARHRLELLAVRRDARRAAVARGVPPLRVDERRDAPPAGLAEEGLHDARREGPLGIVGEEEDVRPLERREPRRDELVLGGAGEPARELLVDAQELPPVGHHPALDRGRPERVDDDAPLAPGERAEVAAQPLAFLLRPHGAEGGGPRSEGREVLDDVAGAARAAGHGRQGEERDGSLRRDARDVPEPRLVEHEVADDDHLHARRGGREGRELSRRHRSSSRPRTSACARRGRTIS